MVTMVEVTVGLLGVLHTVECENFHHVDLPMVVGLRGAPHIVEDVIIHHTILLMVVVGLLGAPRTVGVVIIHLTAVLNEVTIDIKMAMFDRHANIIFMAV